MFPTRRNKRKRTGSILVVFVILLPVIIVILGFSIDYAQMQRTRTELRTATDLAAKSAAIILAETDDTVLAEARAREVAFENFVAGSPLTLPSDGVVFGNSQRHPDGSWDFTPDELPMNAVQVRGARMNDAPDGAVRLPFGIFYGHSDFQSEFSATAAFVNADVVMVLDRSSSMKLATNSTDPLMSTSDPRFCAKPMADSRWVALEDAVNVFLDDIELTTSKERVGIVTFASNNTYCSTTSNRVDVDQPLVEDLALSRDAMAARTDAVWGGMTDIEAGISAGRDELIDGANARQSAVKIMVVLTDGQYTEANPLPAAQSAAAEGILIYTVTLGDGANTSDMIAVADAGNGRHLHANTSAELQGAFREISGAIANIID